MNHKTQLLFRGAPGEESHAIVQIDQWSLRKRLQRGVSGLLLFVFLAICAIPLPGFHFILVPSLLLCAPILAWYRSRKRGVFLGGTAPCPRCQREISLTDHPLLNTFYLECPDCKQQIFAEISDSPSV